MQQYPKEHHVYHCLQQQSPGNSIEEIPFSCYYSSYGVATAVGVKPENRKLVFSGKRKGNFTVVLELFHSKRYKLNICLKFIQRE